MYIRDTSADDLTGGVYPITFVSAALDPASDEDSMYDDDDVPELVSSGYDSDSDVADLPSSMK